MSQTMLEQTENSINKDDVFSDKHTKDTIGGTVTDVKELNAKGQVEHTKPAPIFFQPVIQKPHNEYQKSHNSTNMPDETFNKEEAAISEFVTAIEKHSNLELVGTQLDDNNTECFIVKSFKNPEDKEKFEKHSITVASICGNADKVNYGTEVVNYITGKRNNAIILEGISRIVGYMSKIRNWNSSKALRDIGGNIVGGELFYRKNGNYSTSKDKRLASGAL